ncbi:hypothetical protein [Arthrobacter sp. Soil764]|uniref:hypothetical protein n=1 Tax=Arthrobacter sp. Soil764 TaxID=1736403 RepID=UPI000ABEA696|nr:hypothetical protein [Arthrobacter sp. Soil764]
MMHQRSLRRLPAAGTLICVPACWFAFRRLQLRWGATPEEAGGKLPGDDLIAVAGLQATRSVTVNAPAERVWPWLVQMGQRRG